MREFQQKRQLRRLLYSEFTLAILLIGLFIVTKASWNVYQKEVESRDKASLVTRELVSAQERESALANDIRRLNTQEGIERKIRETFRLAKDGERLVIFLEDRVPVDVDERMGPFESMWQGMKGLFR